MEALAYQAHRASTKESGTGSLLRKDALDLLESDMLLGNMHLAVEFLDYVDQRAGLLVGNGAELNKPTVYSFPHRTFQEYLAGAYLARQRDRVRTFYEHAAEGDSWDLAAQLAFEELYYNRRSENELLDLAYQLDNPSATGEQCERARLWAGQIIILVGKEVTERDTHPNGGKVYLSRLIPSLASILASQVLRIHERASTGNILATLGDPRFNIELCSLPLDDLLGFVHIPAGRFLLGSVNSDPIADETEKPQHEVELSEYWIANYPVTVSQFNFFLKETNYCFKSGPLEQVPNHPITSVTWYDAMEYTKWLSKELLIIAKQKATSGKKHPLWDGIAEGKLFVTLPTEQEWEKSARSGYDNVVYPWGNEFNSEKSNTFETGIRNTIAVGCSGENLFGISDLCGNVWEWTRSILCKYPVLGNPPKTEQIKDTDIIILRGGSYTHDRWFARNSSRGQNFPNVIRKDHGFRVVISQANI